MSRLSAAKNLEAVSHIHSLQFMPVAQKGIVIEMLRGEEGEWFYEVVCELAKTFDTMPKTYEQEDAGDNTLAYIHLFSSSKDWYITEKDMGDGEETNPEQIQAYGMRPNGNMGYINLKEIVEHYNVEVDFHFPPTKIGDLIA